jgi:hypothetical protein
LLVGEEGSSSRLPAAFARAVAMKRALPHSQKHIIGDTTERCFSGAGVRKYSAVAKTTISDLSRQAWRGQHVTLRPKQMD